MANVERLVVGISGASGIGYGLRALDACRELGVETHLVMSRSAALTLAQETQLSVADVQAKADVSHKVSDVGAAIASGSFQTLGMIVAPCSVRTMVKLAEMGAVIAPPLPAFYAKPQSLEDVVDQSVGRALDLFGLAWKPVKRWGEDIGPSGGASADALRDEG